MDFYLANEMEFLQPTSPEFSSDKHYLYIQGQIFSWIFQGVRVVKLMYALGIL